MSSILLRLEKIRKTFPGVIANDDVNLEIRTGEIHALLGENGAGKTSLMNCVYGIYRPDYGKIYWKGKEVHIHQSRDAIGLGIGMVHQHFMLVPPLTVTENVILGLPSAREPFLNLAEAEAKIRASAKRFHLDVDPKAKIWDLPVGVQQRVEILKALYRQAELLILDEPTAVLTPGEVAELFKVLKSLTEFGLSIIFISHKLDEVMALSDRITILRNGRVVDTVTKENTSPNELARKMVGREVFLKFQKPEQQPGDVILSVENISALDNRRLPAVKNISFSIRRGEILAVAGVDGNGQTELAEVLAGMRPSINGKLRIHGVDATNQSPHKILKMNVSYIPPDRQHVGLLMDFSVRENIIGKSFWEKPYTRGGVLQKRPIQQYVDHCISKYDIRTTSPNLKARLLSGGNQQKVVLARELSRKPDLIIASQATRGLDISATEYVNQQMLAARQDGAAILLISSDLEEIFSLADRIAVMYKGEIMGILPVQNADLHLLGEMMAGVRRLKSIGEPEIIGEDTGKV